MSDIESLSPAKRALLERELVKRRAGRAGQGDTIPRRAPGTPVPLSSTQRRMWFLAQWARESFTFNASRAIRLRGPLDRDGLAAALRGLVGRHESLRTLVDPSGPAPLQRVLDDWELPVPVEAVEEPGLAARLRELSQEPFDLTAELPIRATILELDPEDHVLLLRIHHFAADAHSDAIMFDELAMLYSGAVGGHAVVLPEIPVQYADYTLWQEAHLTGTHLEELVDYWRRELEGAPELLNLPTDGPRPPVQRNLGAHRRLTLDRELADALVQLARSEGATFYIATLAAFGAVLYRRSGADDIVIGSPIANRTRVELQPVIGFFSNTLALRLRLGGNPSFRELLRRVRDTATRAYAHQELPFEKLVEAVAPRRNPSYNPLFQVNFRSQVSARTELSLEGLETEVLDVDIGFSRFDLALELELRDDALEGYVEYDTDLFEAASADHLIEDLRALLEHVVSAPDTPLLEVQLPARTAPAQSAGRITRRRRA
jgi:Condensation domain